MKNPTNARCESCPLKQRGLVGSAGNRVNPKLIVVGEGPGTHEAFLSHKPFTGESGKLVRNLIASHNINPDTEMFWTNATLCLPDEGKEEALQLAIVACQDRLKFALSQVGDAPVLALGRWAQRALGIEEQDHWEREKLTGRWAIATLHPAAVLYEPNDLPFLVHGIAKACRPPFEAAPVPRHHLVVEVTDLARLTRYAEDSDRIAFDFELDDEHKVNGTPFLLGISFWRSGPFGLACELEIITREVLETEEFRVWLSWLFGEYGKKLWGHNTKFDAFVAAWNYDSGSNHFGDTMIAADCYQPGWYQGLKDLANYFYNSGDYGKRLVKSWLEQNIKRPKDRTFDKVPAENIHTYLAADIYYTGRLSYDLEALLRQVGRWERPYLLEMNTSSLLTEMELTGLGIDAEHLEATTEWMRNIVSERRAEVVAESNGAVENPSSTKQVSTYLWDVVKPPTHTAKGKAPRSTDESVLLNLIGQGFSHPFLTALRNYRRAHKLLTSYLENVVPFIQHRGGRPTVHTTFKQTRVVTGRLSAVEPAVQTLVKENPGKDGELNFGQRVKNIYIPTQEDYALIGVDGNQWELRVAAVWSQDPFLLECYSNDIDVHSMACDIIYDGKWDDNQRTKEKNVMFGLIYMGHLETLVAETGLPANQVSRMYHFFMGKLGRLLDWRIEMLQQAKRGYIISPYFNQYFDYHLKFKLGDHELGKMAVNYPIQGTASKITMLAGTLAQPKLKAIGGSLLVTVHDNLTGQVPVRYVDEGQEILRSSMVTAGEMFYPDMKWKAKTATALRWGELKA